MHHTHTNYNILKNKEYNIVNKVQLIKPYIIIL